MTAEDVNGGGVRPFGLTVVLQAGDDTEALRFYGVLFGRPPDYSPHDDFHEWQISRDAWVQVTTGCQPPVPAVNRMRFQVADLALAAAALGRHGIAVAPARTLPGVVTFADLRDPWGNPLGLFQDIADTDGPAVPGGTVHDERHFR
jgi:hypothetical protein